MPTLYEAILAALKDMGGTRTIKEVEEYIHRNYDVPWKDIGTVMADMVSIKVGGNHTSKVPIDYRILKRVARGKYSLM